MRNTFYIILIVIILGLGIYLNRAYARIFEGIRQGFLPTIAPTEYTVTATSTAHSTFTYVAYGDSLTNGAGADDTTGTYPYALASALAQKYGTVRVVNKGVLGATSADLVKISSEPLPVTPDLVTVMIGVNDAHYMVSLSQFKKNVNAALDTIQKHGAKKVMLIGSPYIGAPKLVAEPYRTYFAYRTDAFNEALMQIARWRGLEYTNLYEITYSRLSKNGSWYSRDNFHPASSEYRAWASLIYADLNY